MIAQSQYGRIEHNSNLLPPITLEIVVVEEEEECKIVFSETTQNVHPTWEHLDERIGLLEEEEWWLKDDSQIYKNMKLRFYLPNRTLFLEMSLYPASLHKLDSDETPEALPPNSCFIYFSDGSTRLPESLFQILLDQKLTSPPPIEDFSRFEDDVFRTLDTVPQTPSTPTQTDRNNKQIRHQRPSDSLLDGEHEPKTLFPHSAAKLASVTAVQVPKAAIFDFDQSEQDVLNRDLKEEAISLRALIAQEEQALQVEMESIEEVCALQYKQYHTGCNSSLHLFLFCYKHTQQKESLGNMVQTAKDMKAQNEILQNEMSSHKAKLQKEQFTREAQRINLVRGLQTVYPITIDPQKGFLIRNLQLPVDIKTTTVTDEELSAALGFACHLVFIMSKYLSVGLRHKLFCNSSRSAVQQDNVTVYPLFSVRGRVEREKLDYGIQLLGENVNCMLLTFEIEFTLQSHILQRLSNIYEHLLTAGDQASA